MAHKAFTPQHLHYQMFFSLARRSDGYLQRGLGHFCNDQRMPHKLLIILLVAFQQIKQFMLFVFIKKTRLTHVNHCSLNLMRVFIGVRPIGVGGGG